jgi:beta-lactamase regulating signal transducer with metallopeptidase domain
MTTILSLNELAPILAGRMLNSVAEGLVIGLFAWVLLRVMGRRNSSTRFAVWFSALLAIAAVPLFSLTGPHSTSAGRVTTAITIPSSWALTVLAMWAMIASVSLARVGIGLWQLRKLRASCSHVDTSTLDPVARETLHRFHPVRSVQLCESDRVRVPTALGFLKPLVVIPPWAIHELSPAELNSILIHELAHLRRWDDWTNLAQQVLKALLFFHPAVWWIENKLALEREMACDDAVLAETANPRGYAQCLVSLAEKSFMRRGLAMAQAIVNRLHQTSLRVSQILDGNRPSATRIWKPALYSVAAFSLVCLVSLPHAPELVAFEDTAPAVASLTASPAVVPISAGHSIVLPKNVAAFAVNMSARKQEPGKAILAKARPQRNVARPMESDLSQTVIAQPGEVAFIEDRPKPQTILVVMQTDQYRYAGPVLWKVSVWQLVIFDASRPLVETRLPAKQI